jgi:hypothetical protein
MESIYVIAPNVLPEDRPKGSETCGSGMFLYTLY